MDDREGAYHITKWRKGRAKLPRKQTLPSYMSSVSRIQSILINAAIVMGAFLFILVAGELSIRTLEATGHLVNKPSKEYKQNIRKIRKLNARMIRSTNPVLYLEYDPDDPNINNAGHRGADIIKEKKAGEYRIAIIGDSVTYGYGVDIQHTFPALLQQKLDHLATPRKKYTVLNFGVSGYGTVSELELYKTKIADYKPDLVLLQYTLNDPMPTELVVQTVSESRAASKYLAWIVSKSHFAGWFIKTFNQATRSLRAKNNYASFYGNEALWKKQQDAIAQFRELTNTNNSRFSVVIFPLLLPYDDYSMQKFHDMITGVLETQGIHYLDLLHVYSEADYKSLKLNDDDNTHPSPLGHQMAAEAIYQDLQKNNLL